MNAALLAAVLLAAFAAIDGLTQRMKVLRWAPLALYALGLAVAGTEFAGYDHGHPDWLLWIGFVGAPVIVIFGGAAWGVRRWYGWPDFGPVPGRLALVAGALLVGILFGSSRKGADVEESMRRGDAYASALRLDDGPSALLTMGAVYETTAMGLFSPPPFRFDRATGLLSFPIGGGREMTLDYRAPAKDAKWKLR